MTEYFVHNLCRMTASLSLAALLAACQVSTVQEPSDAPQMPAKPAISRSPAVPHHPVPSSSTAAPLQETVEFRYENLWHRVADSLNVQQQYEHASIDRELAWYLDHPRYLDRITTRAAPFMFAIVEEVEKRNLPLELALLPVVESAFDPTAYSPEHAAGLWQFIPATGRSYGLSSDWWYDGRHDPLASTRAALDYLQFLHDEFDGNWLLAIAAYNTGEGNVRRALRRSGQKPATADFWALRLPAETRGHVPRLLAISRLIANADEFGIQLPALANTPYLEVVELDFQLDLATAAQVAEVDEELLKTLNAGYLQWATHPDYPQSIVVPRDRAQLLRNAVADMPADRRVAWDHYQIQRGDTLGGIARRFSTRVEVLQSVNNIRGTRIVAGRSLLIPRSGLSARSAGLIAAKAPGKPSPTPTSYRIRRGDNLWRIARRYDLSSSDIAAWNGIALDSVLHPGQLLTLHPTGYLAAADIKNGQEEQTINYSVIRGDSLDRIARRFNVTVDNLSDWNSLDPNALIYPGQEIRVRLKSNKLN